MRYHGLGPLGAKAIALPLKVCLNRNKMKTKNIRLSKQYQKSTNKKTKQNKKKTKKTGTIDTHKYMTAHFPRMVETLLLKVAGLS